MTKDQRPMNVWHPPGRARGPCSMVFPAWPSRQAQFAVCVTVCNSASRNRKKLKHLMSLRLSAQTKTN
eukprot:scaffold112626_cov46-Prasinocladus_malaysianus.AAC.1